MVRKYFKKVVDNIKIKEYNKQKWRKNMVFCQSCGRPLNKGEDFGTNADSSKNNDYCVFCYKDGKFTQDVTMEGMIEICVPIMVKVNKDMTAEKARKSMQERFPKLKRWKTV
jgi:hypothetical protein